MSPSRSFTDSPWFWVYLFSTAALIALALIGPKFGSRQAQIEREFQGRQRTAQNLNGQEPSGELSTEGQTLITLRPLFLGLATVTIGAWFLFWRVHFAQHPNAESMLLLSGKGGNGYQREASVGEPAVMSHSDPQSP
jgi:hypothetical protein